MPRYGREYWNRFEDRGYRAAREGGYDAEPFRGRFAGRGRGYGREFGTRGGGMERDRGGNRFHGGLPEYYSGTYRTHGTIGESPGRGGLVQPEPPAHRFRASRDYDFYQRRGR